MKSRSTCMLFAIALAGAAGAQATPLGERASIELFAGGERMSGSFGGLSESPVDAPGSIHADRVEFDDAYRHRYTGGAELDYAFDSQLSASARFGYAQLDGRSADVAHIVAGDASTTPVTARFGDTATRELDVGARYAFMPGAKVHPFVGASLGAARLSPIRATVVAAGATGTRVELGSEDTVFTQRMETGVQYSPVRNFGVRLTVAADHVDGQRGSDDPNLALLGLSNTRSDLRAHWDYPVELGVVKNF